ncbi:predicted competence protein [Malacoplasma penetrans HF-2]|uniref:Predicted competence protein n=1 Tax=Malacoplasma penetrans (strain HF-2) TaxID=272633 RepID=Q8EX07_MALP2|nr:ComEC/Rec2 family competence protein [Malacoplasma penetrans]BAC43833.1 predicted competence protein [Malacoplasma penetrans HF-2]
MKITNTIILWMLACCFYMNSETVSSTFLFLFFFGSCLVNHVNKFKVLLISGLGFIFLFYVLSFETPSSFNFLNDYLNKIMGINLREIINSYFIKIHGQTLGSFISLVLLNIKNDYNYPIYYKLIDLSIVHLIVISSYHINIFCGLVNKIFHKFPTLGRIISALLSFTISYLNGFSPSSIRVFCANVFGIFKSTRNCKANLSFIFLGLVAPKVLISFGFLMSFLGSRGVKLFYKTHNSGKLYEAFFTSIFATIYIIPSLGIINNSISLWGVFLSLLYSPIFILVYIFLFIFSWVNWLDPVFIVAYNLIFEVSKVLEHINVVIPISIFKNEWIFSIYYSSLELFNLYIFRKRSSMKWKLNKLERVY